MFPFLVVSLAWFFQAFTGFGAGIFIVGVLSLLYNPKEVVVSSSLVNLWGNLFVFLSLRSKSSPAFGLLVPLVLGSLLGIAISSKILILISEDALRALIGAFILLLGVYDLSVQRGILRVRLRESFGNGLLAGFLGGLFAGLESPFPKLSEYVKPHALKQIISLSVLLLGAFLFLFSL